VFLKRIVLHGFKSFADRTEFDFDAGVTGIVGPNGCGKSNVLDAVRWVLGEQSARNLRGGKMLDVVFAGSRSRKPANFAEVQLTFDNRTGILRSDDQEVVVGRVLYRSGDSEYRLNGKSCRLKDIRNLLLDTGVGVDAYSVIEQGRVDLLLQASPVERREIFEEAAGISRYKVRRIEAQRKLDRTQSNLLRLQDIVEELERQLRSVRLAAGKARNFQEYDRRLRELRSSFSMAEYHELESRRVAIQDQLTETGGQLQAQRADLAERDAELAELERERQSLDDAIQTAESELLELRTALSALLERIAQTERQLPELAAMQQRRAQEAEAATERATQLADRVDQQRQEHAAMQAAEQSSASRLAAAEQDGAALETRRTALRDTLRSAQEATYDAARKAALLQNEATNLEQQQARLEAQRTRLDERRSVISGEHQELTDQLEQKSSRAAELDEQAAAENRTLRDDEAQLKQLFEQAEQLDAGVGAAKEQRSALLSRLSVLEDLERRLEGVAQGAQAVLGWRGEDETWRDLVVGLVADVIQIDDPRLHLLQPVLATIEDHVVVRAAEAVADALQQRDPLPSPLRVIALDRVAPATARVRFDQMPGYVACAADWVQCADAYRPLAAHLLGRVVVVDTLTAALRCADRAPADYLFVTLAGETAGADGRLVFGAGRRSAGLISRKAEIRQHQIELEEVESRLVQLTRSRLETEQATSDAQLRKQATLERIATLQREHAETRTACARIGDARARLERERGLLGDELDGVARSVAEVHARLDELATERESVGAAQCAHEARLDALAEQMQALEVTANRLSQERTDALVARERAGEKRAALEASLQELEAQREKIAAQHSAARQEVQQITARHAALAEALERDQVTATEREAAVGELEQAQQSRRTRRQDLRGRVEACGTAERAVQKQIEALEGTLHEHEVQRRELEVRKENLTARVQEELDLDLDALHADYEHTEQDWDAIKAEIDELRGKIARLGNVNLDAIRELEELAPRYERLVEQRSDLEDAIKRLETLIAELDSESRARFSATFEQVRTNFQEMFRKLFGGGKADIVLEDPDDPLECGIEIIARPPGKEPQSISLLSGGEKTLTAVALLMAVFKSRPSPFAILDEVDAALDEANIERFNTVLQEFLSHSQFVVITHSKRTMACADVLYGVTMEEPGVSKRVSVRFDDRVRAPEVA
jgi:chromosome segregation protein